METEELTTATDAKTTTSEQFSDDKLQHHSTQIRHISIGKCRKEIGVETPFLPLQNEGRNSVDEIGRNVPTTIAVHHIIIINHMGFLCPAKIIWPLHLNGGLVFHLFMVLA